MDPEHNEDLAPDENEDTGADVLYEEDIIQVIDVPDQADEPVSDEDMEEQEEGAASFLDMAVCVFSGHKDAPHSAEEPAEVYSVHMDPTGTGRVVSGGRDDRALVWDSTTGQVILQCSGHTDSVDSVGFSADGRYVATADLKGMLKVWVCSSKQEVWTNDCESDVMWLQWHPKAPVLLAGLKDGNVWMWQISEKRKDASCKVFPSGGHPALCARVLSDGKRVCVGYANGVVKLWDLQSNSGQAVFTWQHAVMPEEEMADDAMSDSEEERPKREEEELTSPVAILSLDCSADDALVMSGCVDSTAKVFSTKSGKLVSTFVCAASDNADQDNSVESVSFSPDGDYAATATNSGSVKIWDVSRAKERHHFKHQEGVCKVKWLPGSLMVVTACMDGIARVWDARSGALKGELTGHHRDANINDLDVNTEGNYLVTASEDGTARVFDLKPLLS